MIRIASLRDKSGEHFDQGVRLVSVGRALTSLLRYELGFGGVVKKCGVNSGRLELVVVTHVLGCVDTTFFSSRLDEGDGGMRLLVGAAWLYTQSREDRFEADVGELVKNTGGSPLLITACGPRICELFGGVPCREFLDLKDGDFWAAIELVADGARAEDVLGVAV